MVLHARQTLRQHCSRDQHFFYHYRGVIHSHHAIYFLSAHNQWFCSGMQWAMLLYLISFNRFPPEQMIATWYKMQNLEGIIFSCNENSLALEARQYRVLVHTSTSLHYRYYDYHVDCHDWHWCILQDPFICVMAVTLLYLDMLSCHHHMPAGYMQTCKVCSHSLLLAEMQPLLMSMKAKERVSHAVARHKKSIKIKMAV